MSDRMMELVEWLRARLDADEQVALEASRAHGDQTTTGEHWRWEDPERDEPLELDPALEDFIKGGETIALRSVEEYPTRHVGPLPHFVLPYASEVETVCGMHIARHDPARVLADVDAKRRIIEAALGEQDHGDFGWAWTQVLALLALPYADRPGYQDEWRP
ncbi:MAG: hypothetical protein IRZ05_20110 [Micromonosporaceae bacterium]|nr:hypothetical protein [Micromonosporaceae bacterium]